MAYLCIIACRSRSAAPDELAPFDVDILGGFRYDGWAELLTLSDESVGTECWLLDGRCFLGRTVRVEDSDFRVVKAGLFGRPVLVLGVTAV